MTREKLCWLGRRKVDLTSPEGKNQTEPTSPEEPKNHTIFTSPEEQNQTIPTSPEYQNHTIFTSPEGRNQTIPTSPEYQNHTISTSPEEHNHTISTSPEYWNHTILTSPEGSKPYHPYISRGIKTIPSLRLPRDTNHTILTSPEGSKLYHLYVSRVWKPNHHCISLVSKCCMTHRSPIKTKNNNILYLAVSIPRETPTTITIGCV